MELGRITADTTFVIERRLKASIDRVWSYFVDGEKRARWFTGGDTLSADGQNFAMIFAHKNITSEKPPERWKDMDTKSFPMGGRVLAFDPPRLLAITWGDGDEHVSEVRFEFTAVGDETLLTLTHSKIDKLENTRDFAGGWTAHMETLATVLAGKPANHFWADVVAAHAAYDAQAQ